MFNNYVKALTTAFMLLAYAPIQAQLSGSSAEVSKTASAAAPPTSQVDPVVKSFKKTVLFLEADCLIKNTLGQDVIVPHLGTAFIVAYKDEKNPDVEFTYLVTNKHVAYPGTEDNTPCNISDYKMRVNLKKPTSEGLLSAVFSLGRSVPWLTSKDSSVDLAVTPFRPNAEVVDYLAIPSDALLSEQQAGERRVVEGDSVLFTGLFIQFLGQARLEPIVREGKIAMLPEEPVPTTLRTVGHVYLVDTHVFGGNSGSPLFVNLAGQRDNGFSVGTEYRLLGIVSGYVQETSDLKLQAVASYAGTVVANSGVAMVVPSQSLLDLLHEDRLREDRDKGARLFHLQQTQAKK